MTHTGLKKHPLLIRWPCYLAPHPLQVVWKRLLTFLRFSVGFWEALYKLEGEEEEEKSVLWIRLTPEQLESHGSLIREKKKNSSLFTQAKIIPERSQMPIFFLFILFLIIGSLEHSAVCGGRAGGIAAFLSSLCRISSLKTTQNAFLMPVRG